MADTFVVLVTQEGESYPMSFRTLAEAEAFIVKAQAAIDAKGADITLSVPWGIKAAVTADEAMADFTEGFLDY